jgi:dTDP-glucose 4,6-dehydratase
LWFFDAVAWAVALGVAAVLRYDFQLSQIDVTTLVAAMVLVAVVQLGGGMLGSLYQGRYSPGSLEEVRALAWVMAIESVVLGVACVFLGLNVGLPRSLVFVAAPLAGCLMLGRRYLQRLLADRSQVIDPGRLRTLIFGAGSLGAMTVQRMKQDTRSPYLPVGFVDDDPGCANLSIRDVPVLGGLDDLPAVVAQAHASVLVVALANPNSALMARVMEATGSLEMDVKVVPTMEKSLDGRRDVGEMRGVIVDDLIERPPVVLDIPSIADYVCGRRVLVTGAGGSIGQELCVQIQKYNPSALILLDHDETHLQDTEFALYGTGLLENPEIVLADIRAKTELAGVFERWRPQVVFHAAALKHVPMLQNYPREAWDTNVIGTLNALRCAQAADVEVFVNISTDKAANPTTVLGHSKRLAERLTSWMGEQTGRRYCSVRFGNVLGSRGSMVPLFTKMIDRGLPITVTSQTATRYFMTIPEACELVVQAGAIGDSGDVLILDMGSPVRIMDIVERLMDISGKRSPIHVTGLRAGEKSDEVLFSQGELVQRTQAADRTWCVPVAPFDPSGLDYEAWVVRAGAGGVEEDEAPSRRVTRSEPLRLDDRWGDFQRVGVR